MKMKYLLLFILMPVTWTISVGQELVTVRNTVNHFEIGVPVGWQYGVPVDKSVTFIALRQKVNGQDLPRENYNINILYRDEKDIDKVYKQFLESVGRAEGFKIIEQGDKIINDRKYKYLIETHKNKVSKEDMNNYVLFTNNEGEILILTMVTTSENFDKFKGLYDAIANSLKY